MLTIKVEQLDWDEYNIAHIARHNVTTVEFEEVCYDAPIERRGYCQRIVLIGLTMEKRILTLVLEPRGKAGMFRPVTAYDASRKSRREYETERTGGEQAA
jgi:uncharacterized DUF497 family protein